MQHHRRNAAAATVLIVAAAIIAVHGLGGGRRGGQGGTTETPRSAPLPSSAEPHRSAPTHHQQPRPAIHAQPVGTTVPEADADTGATGTMQVIHGTVAIPEDLQYRDMLVAGCGTTSQVGDDGRFTLRVDHPPCFVSVVLINTDGRIDLGVPRQFTGSPADDADGAFDFLLDDERRFETLSAAIDRLYAGRDKLAEFCTAQRDPPVVDACLNDVVGAWDARLDAIESAAPLLAAMGVLVDDANIREVERR